MNRYDVLVVGAGFAGSVCAERLASAGKRLLLIDKRAHIAGNAFDLIDDHGVLIHAYGPHIFHTNGKRIFEYLSQFTDWRFYEHRVRAIVDGQGYPMPINRTTINRLYGLDLDEAGAAAFLERVREPRESVRTSEDVILNSVGRDLCEKFFRGYTRKQWGIDLSELSAGVAARIPTRTDDDDRYFTDTFQFMPAAGYTEMFRRMLDHGNIEVRLKTDYFDICDQVSAAHTIFTGPIDAFYNYRFGKLPYRSLRFEHRHIEDKGKFQEVGTVNYPNDHEFTRITEFKHLTGQSCAGTSIVREYPQSEGEPYYPIPRPETEALFKRYQELARQESDISFVGRLAQYRYYNMDQVVGASLKTAGEVLMALKDAVPDILV
jgi:UDP-galactopyranose mutase